MLTADDRKGINAARAAIVAAILAADPEAYALCYTNDGIGMHPDTPYIRGREALREYAATVFAVVKVTSLEITPVVMEGEGGMAHEVGRQLLDIEPADDRFKHERQYLHVYKKEADGVWRIAAAMSGNSQ